MVNINNPTTTDPDIDDLYSNFCGQHNLTGHLKVATFIFPQRLHEIYNGNKEKIFKKQKRVHKVVKGRWGSYFDQMVEWKESKSGASINQLDRIINLINQRNTVYKTAYTIQITNPISHINYPMAGPCLRYILLQLQSNPNKISLMAVYRNHDFAEKAYGNYVGLGNLLKFIASEINYELGSVTCVSSHAYIESKYKSGLKNIIKEVTDEL